MSTLPQIRNTSAVIQTVYYIPTDIFETVANPAHGIRKSGQREEDVLILARGACLCVIYPHSNTNKSLLQSIQTVSTSPAHPTIAARILLSLRSDPPLLYDSSFERGRGQGPRCETLFFHQVLR